MRVEQTVSYLVLGTVGVAVAVLGVAELVLGVELAGWRLNYGSDGGDWGNWERLGKGGRSRNHDRLRRKGERYRLSG